MSEATNTTDVAIQEHVDEIVPQDSVKANTDTAAEAEEQSKTEKDEKGEESVPEHPNDPVDHTVETVDAAKQPEPKKLIRKIPLPSLSSLSDLPLRSPSTQIVGTPFPIDSPKFEYPFPSPGSQPASSASGSPVPSPLISHISGSSFSAVPLSVSPNYTPSHPKLRIVNVNPPEPPGLAKKRQRWSLGLGLLLRRKSSDSAESVGSRRSLISPREEHPSLPGPSSSMGRDAAASLTYEPLQSAAEVPVPTDVQPDDEAARG